MFPPSMFSFHSVISSLSVSISVHTVSSASPTHIASVLGFRPRLAFGASSSSSSSSSASSSLSASRASAVTVGGSASGDGSVSLSDARQTGRRFCLSVLGRLGGCGLDRRLRGRRLGGEHLLHL